MPSRFAMRALKLTYLERVQQETTKYLSSQIKHDFLRPDRELTLDLSVKEARTLLSAGDHVRRLADSGELKQLHERYNATKTRVENEYLAFREHLAKTLQNVEGKENEIYIQLLERGFEKLKLNGDDAPLMDALGFSSGDASLDNLSIIEAAHQKGDESLGSVVAQLHAYIGVKAKIFALDAKLKSEHINYVAQEDVSFARDEWKTLENASKVYSENFNRRPVSESAQAEFDSYINSINDSEAQSSGLVQDFQAFERVHNERKQIYADFQDTSAETGVDRFRVELLHHLAGSIVVKESRKRYQKEQFDRLMATLQSGTLTSSNESLRDFCQNYANLIEVLIEDSHNDRSPKIEANYDDFGEKTIRPINATIFYYFFSADRRKRTIAQWLLSAVRYPNERVRRAYMHFFA